MRLLLTVSSDEELPERRFIQGTKHAKRARKKTNKLLHIIQIVLNMRRHSVVTVPYDTLQRL